MSELYVPSINYETLVLAANELKSCSPQKFRNNTRDLMWAKYILLDDNGNDIYFRFGVRGGPQFDEQFVSFSAFRNTYVNGASTDAGMPFFRLDVPFMVPPSMGLTVELEDTLSPGFVRPVHVVMTGRRVKSGGPFNLVDRVEVPSGGFIVASLQSDQSEPVAVHGFTLREEDPGGIVGVASGRALLVKVIGGGLADWSPVRVPSSVAFPHRNGGTAVYEIPSVHPLGMPLKPTEGFNFELLDAGGAGGTATISMIGYVRDRR